MDPQIAESFGWLFLMLYFPLLRISDKIAERFYPVVLLVIPGIIYICFQNANYSTLLSFILALFYIFVMFIVPNNDSLKKHIDLYEPREFFIFLTITFTFLFMGIYLKTYIFIISSYIYGVLTYFQYINDVYLDIESPPIGPRDRYQFKPGLQLYISAISIFFILESFGISEVFAIIDTASIHWLYSTIAQVFSALLGIIILIGFFIFNSKEEENSKKRLANMLIGFIILCIILILLSIIGIAIHHETDDKSGIYGNNIDLKLDTIIPDKSFGERQLPDSNQILYSGLFTIILTLIFSSFIYLYVLFRIIFKLGHKFETQNVYQ